jgi:DNA-binding winged helix-turn-helix (wHTH) protein
MNLRRKIEQDPAQPRYVQTVYGRGYRLADHSGRDPATDDCVSDSTARDLATDGDDRQPDPTAGAQT